jgi:hypothetical protein
MVISLCVQDTSTVKNAKPDITYCQREVNPLETALEYCRRFLESLKKPDPGKTAKVVSPVGIRVLKPPLESSGVEDAIKKFDRCSRTISLGLHVEQAYVADAIPPNRGSR